MEIRVLREGDERSEFRSAEPDLDRFFHKFAGQNQFRHYLGVTYVAVERNRVIGFATVAARARSYVSSNARHSSSVRQGAMMTTCPSPSRFRLLSGNP